MSDFAAAATVYAELAAAYGAMEDGLHDHAMTLFFEAGARAAIDDAEAVPRLAQARDAFAKLIASGGGNDEIDRLHALCSRGANGDIAAFRIPASRPSTIILPVR